MFRRNRWIAIAIGVQSCSLFTESVPKADGSFDLVKYGDAVLPVQIDELPTRTGQPSGCWNTLTEGGLGLNAADHYFSYYLVFRDSCDGHVLSQGGASGHFQQFGSSLTFHVQTQQGDFPFAGRVLADTVVLEGTPYFYFKKVP